MNDPLAKNLRQLRGAKIQDEWAKEFGVNKMTVSKWERGLQWPQRKLLLKIAQKFNLKILDLFREDLFVNGAFNRSPSIAGIPSELIEKLQDPENIKLLQCVLHLKSNNPAIDSLALCDAILNLPSHKQAALFELIK